ncbi:NAD(P)/FAD-dependent oxidoreductase [Jiella avicenniae]|uniref:FAD-dependent monooxygenase n=1 Tax=Jiella avicenniae TaxID=2907202 RepID=A0A9X1T400_9HYPH|nr:FAD-dependent monooxygenase [Jiella avicenniae]
MHDTAVLVVGGGPAGCATALSLARHGVPFLIARRPSPARGYGEHLAPEARPLLRQLGAEGVWQSPAHRPCAAFRVAWGSRAFLRRDAVSNPDGPGLALDRAVFDADLAALVPPDRTLPVGHLVEVARDRGRWLALFRNGGWALAVAADILVDATGRGAACSRRVGAERRRGPDLVALHHRGVPTEACADGGAFSIASGPQGWCYAVRLADESLVSVLVCLSEPALARPASRAASWQEALRSLRLPAPRLPEGAAPRLVPCGPQQLAPPAGAGWLGVGDAAVAFDPVTGGGIARALQSGIAAADAVAAHHSGDSAAFGRYAEAEQATAVALDREALRTYRSARENGAFWRIMAAD